MSRWCAGSDLQADRGFLELPVDESRVGEVRRAAHSAAMRVAFDETLAAKVALVATELATNVARHGGGGTMLVRTMLEPPAIEMLALDAGPGMRDVSRALDDGYSTGGTSGTGLGAVRRTASTFDIWSYPGQGTVVLARIERDRPAPGAAPVPDVGVVCSPLAGEPAPGDGWAADESGGAIRALVVDGLGHGPNAHAAAREAIAVFRRYPALGPADLLPLLHDGLRPTRGAAIAVVKLDPFDGVIRFAGIGNLSAMVVTSTAQRNLMSHNGTVGHEMRRIQEVTEPWPDGASVIVHTDGIRSRWRVSDYPGILNRHPALLAGLVFRDQRRTRDDATVLVLRAPHEVRR